MLYKGADLIRDVEFVIFDEVHYVNDAEVGWLMLFAQTMNLLTDRRREEWSGRKSSLCCPNTSPSFCCQLRCQIPKSSPAGSGESSDANRRLVSFANLLIDSISRTKKKDIYVISTPMRPVPLEHFLWAGKELHKIIDSKSQFLGEGYVLDRLESDRGHIS